MKKRLFLSTILLAIAILLPLKSQAYDFSAVAPSGQTLYYNIVDGNAQVTKQNTSYPYYTTYPTGNLTIPSTVTFNGTTYSVTSIDGSAFFLCGSLTSITMPNSVISIGNQAFSGCIGLSSLTIPNSVTTINRYAFYSCSGLTSITFGNSVITIDDHAFNDCTGLTGTLSIPNSVTTIGDRAFSGCNGLTALNIGSSVSYIGLNPFPASSLASIVVDSGNTVYDSRNNCNAIIKTATNELISGCKNTIIPNTVLSIGKDAFVNCIGLNSITIPNSVTTIKWCAFFGCTGLTSITIPNAVSTIDQLAFCNCSGLTSLTIGNSVTSIGSKSFSGCTGLTEIYSLNNVAPVLDESFESYNSYEAVSSTIPVYIPCGASASYYSRWSYFSNLIEDCGSNSIDDMTFTPDNIKIHTRGNTIVIETSDALTQSQNNAITVYNVMGRVIKQAADSGQQAAVEIPVTSAGVYMVKVGERPSRKVVVRP